MTSLGRTKSTLDRFEVDLRSCGWGYGANYEWTTRRATFFRRSSRLRIAMFVSFHFRNIDREHLFATGVIVCALVVQACRISLKQSWVVPDPACGHEYRQGIPSLMAHGMIGSQPQEQASFGYGQFSSCILRSGIVTYLNAHSSPTVFLNSDMIESHLLP